MATAGIPYEPPGSTVSVSGSYHCSRGFLAFFFPGLLVLVSQRLGRPCSATPSSRHQSTGVQDLRQQDLHAPGGCGVGRRPSSVPVRGAIESRFAKRCRYAHEQWQDLGQIAN
ncbi:hypothetical protein GY45DRAFT_386649 [Cubamyces sp. BRFM 1775]|nr:hypothetical protein GY45DRAFT_386649 [Cubamyces sp. BRFM 1775]